MAKEVWHPWNRGIPKKFNWNTFPQLAFTYRQHTLVLVANSLWVKKNRTFGLDFEAIKETNIKTFVTANNIEIQIYWVSPLKIRIWISSKMWLGHLTFKKIIFWWCNDHLLHNLLKNTKMTKQYRPFWQFLKTYVLLLLI